LATLIQAWTIRLPERWLPLHAMFMLFIAMSLIDCQMVGGLAVYATWGYFIYVVLHFIISKLSRDSFYVRTEGGLAPSRPRAVS
jgi:hypothetical protein